MPSRSTNPIAMAFNILEEYQKPVRGTLVASGCPGELQRKILSDLYATDEVYLSINRPYKRESGTFADFSARCNLHEQLKEMLPQFEKSNLYVHQVRAIESILDTYTTIISTGTGSGKTESFLIPIFDYCLKQRGIRGVKAVILYPINALAADQLQRIKKATGQQGITVGSFVGSTPQGERDRLINNPPDILITNYVMLDRLLTKERPRSMFERSTHTLRFLVVDEIHYYRGTKGANLCLLLRRLRTLCADKGQLVQIGASATLRQGGGYYSDNDQQQIETFARSLFGQEATQRFKFITPIYDDFHPEEGAVDPFPGTDQPPEDFSETQTHSEAIRKLADHLAGMPLPPYFPGRKQLDPLFQFAKRNLFLGQMREELQKKACTLDELTELFRRVYCDNHHREPRQPKQMVYAYLRLVNYLNFRHSSGAPSVPEALLDYRLHLILSNLEGKLTRCLRCGRYHDGQRKHCVSCNGLLFSVSKRQPDLCLARCNSYKLWPRLHRQDSDTRHTYTVLVQPLIEPPSSEAAQRFAIEPDLEAEEDDESYLLRTLRDDSEGVTILGLAEDDWLHELELEPRRLYWQNVQRVVDAVIIKPDTKIDAKMLAFIDNREKASGIRFRLRDEIAERTLTIWAAAQWAASGPLPLLTAYRRLAGQAQQYLHTIEETDDLLGEILREMPFWFARMLTRPDEYDSWQIRLDEGREKSLSAEERLLLREVFFPHGAIDRSAFNLTTGSEKLKHFYLEKYRVSTEYGLGLASVKEIGYDVTSLGEQGQIYRHVIEQLGAAHIEDLLLSLRNQGILVCKQSVGGMPFYQLNPAHLTLACSSQQALAAASDLPLAHIECHTADHTSKERADYEQRFSQGKIHALICTPTLEMGVDIGGLSCAAMIGFPPSPANYAQRAGRAGRNSMLRSATIIVLSSSGSSYDAYYAADPRKMIDGTISPPQFSLANTKLLAAHIYAYLLAGQQLGLLKSREKFSYRVERFIANDELELRSELGDEYEEMADFLREDMHRSAGQISDHEQGYRRGLFPDYGFRKDGVPLLDPAQLVFEKEDSEARILTRREPEEAVRKLVPGRIVYCGGRPVRVKQNQPRGDAYDDKAMDPEGQKFRAFRHFIAEERDEQYVYARRDLDALYLVRRELLVREPVAELQTQGPGYCRVHLIRKGTLYFINEGMLSFRESETGFPIAVPFHDQDGDYRVGATLTRDGLLLSLAEQILPPDTRANILAILLRSIPDYFNLDDGELRVASNVELFSPDTRVSASSQKYIFLYGHDESGLIPFERIFEHLSEFLKRHLQVLESCSCDDNGCYHCLLSFNSQYLTGTLSRQQAASFLRAYLEMSLLHPYITLNTPTPAQMDLLLKVNWRGRGEVQAENRLTGTTKMYVSEKGVQDQNTAIYETIHNALLGEATTGTRSVRILCNPSYIHDQLQGKAKVTKGQEAFFQVMLTLRTWENWTSIAERGK